MCNLQVFLAGQTITVTENSRFKCIHQCPKHCFPTSSCPSATNQTLMWCASWKMFCLVLAQFGQASPCFSTFLMWLSSQALPLQAPAGVQWVAVEISTKTLRPKCWGIRREGSSCPKAGSVTKKQNNLAHYELRGCQIPVRTGVVSGGAGMLWVWRWWWAQGLLDCLLCVVGWGILSPIKLLLLRAL